MRYRFQSGEQIYEIAIERQGETYQSTIDGQPYPFEVIDSQPGQITLRFNDRPLTLYWAVDGGQKWVSHTGCTYKLEKPRLNTSRPAGEPGAGAVVRAPMPAQVRAVQVAEGDTVEKGQTILLLEAMKMEIRIKSPASGKITRLRVEAGQTVEKEQVLAEVAAGEPTASQSGGSK